MIVQGYTVSDERYAAVRDWAFGRPHFTLDELVKEFASDAGIRERGIQHNCAEAFLQHMRRRSLVEYDRFSRLWRRCPT